jgi:hypothetical protein
MDRCCQAIAITLWTVSALTTHVALGHPAHSTYAEAEWNSESRRIEVAYQLRSYDLEQALQDFCGRPVDLEKTEQLDKLLAEYFSKYFYVEWESSVAATGERSVKNFSTPAGPSSEQPLNHSVIHWIGNEFNAKITWVYFELEIDGTPDGKRLVNRVLLDILDRQTNVVELGIGHRQLTLQFDDQNSRRLIEEASGKRRLLPRKRPR